MSRVLVTGAAGFVTLNIARALATRGHEVVALDRRPPDDAARAYVGAAVRWSVGDVREPDVLGRAFKTSAAEVVVHGAAVTATTPEWERDRAGDVLGVNVLGTINTLVAAHAGGVQRLIVLSSASAVGRGKWARRSSRRVRRRRRAICTESRSGRSSSLPSGWRRCTSCR